MLKRLGLGAAAFFLAATAWAQEEDAKTILKKGLESSAQGGGVKLEGNVDHSSPFGQMGVQVPGMDGGGLTGKFTGTVGTNGILHIKVENDKGSYELFQRKDKIVQRQTWTGTQVQAGAFPNEVSAFLAFSSLVKSLDKAKELKKADPAKVGDVECDVVKGQLPVGLVSEESDDDHAQGFKFKMWELKKIEATFYIDKKDRRIQKVEVKLTRGMSSMIRMNMPGGQGGKDDDDEDDDDDNNNGQPGFGNMAKMKSTSTYSYTITGYNEQLEVKVPEEMKKYFQE